MAYMTYAMKIQEERDAARAEGRIEGRTEGKVEDIKSLMKKKGWSIDEALKIKFLWRADSLAGRFVCQSFYAIRNILCFSSGVMVPSPRWTRFAL